VKTARLFDVDEQLARSESLEDRERRATLLQRWLVERFGANVVDLLPEAEPGTCDDCGRDGPRRMLGRLLLCRDCARTRRAIGAAAA
jgi:hypothetical protein